MQRHCSANLYVTPPNVPMSLRPHNDYQCVFIVQLSGRKSWALWEVPELMLPLNEDQIEVWTQPRTDHGHSITPC